MIHVVPKLAMAAILTGGITSTPADIHPPFRGVTWGMHKSKVVMPKDYVLIPDDDPMVLGWSGKIVGDDVAVFLHFTPKTFRLWRVGMIAGNKSNFADSQIVYNHYHDILTQKYGKPTKTYEYFKPPYESGDGNEDIALSTGNYTRISFWVDQPTGSLSAEITKQGWVNMQYESKEFIKLRQSEAQELAQEVL
jgi:hypothetical protein